MRSSRLPVPWSFAMASLSNVRMSLERISVVDGAGPDRRAPARATVLDQALGAFRRVRSDDHELGHVRSPFRARSTPFARVCRSACDRLAPARAPPNLSRCLRGRGSVNISHVMKSLLAMAVLWLGACAGGQAPRARRAGRLARPGPRPYRRPAET